MGRGVGWPECQSLFEHGDGSARLALDQSPSQVIQIGEIVRFQSGRVPITRHGLFPPSVEVIYVPQPDPASRLARRGGNGSAGLLYLIEEFWFGDGG